MGGANSKMSSSVASEKTVFLTDKPEDVAFKAIGLHRPMLASHTFRSNTMRSLAPPLR